MEPRDGHFGVGYEHALGDLEGEGRRFEPGLVEHAAYVVDEAGVAELAGRQVDRDGQAIPTMGKLPVPGSPTGLPQHPASDLDDEAVLLGEVDELGRGNQATSGMLPAHERLQRHHLAGAE